MAWYFDRPGATFSPVKGPSARESRGFAPDVQQQQQSTKDAEGVGEKSESVDQQKGARSCSSFVKMFISLSSDDGAGGTGGGQGDDGGDRGGGGEQKDGEEESTSPRSTGALADYFSSLFDESFCSHNFKLVG